MPVEASKPCASGQPDAAWIGSCFLHRWLSETLAFDLHARIFVVQECGKMARVRECGLHAFRAAVGAFPSRAAAGSGGHVSKLRIADCMHTGGRRGDAQACTDAPVCKYARKNEKCCVWCGRHATSARCAFLAVCLCSALLRGLENEQSPLPARASGPIHPFGSLSVCLSVSVSGGVPAGLHVSVHVCASACTCMDATGKPNTSKQCLRMQTTGHPYPVPWRLQKGLTAASAVALQDAGRRWSSGDDHWAHDSQRT